MKAILPVLLCVGLGGCGPTDGGEESSSACLFSCGDTLGCYSAVGIDAVACKAEASTECRSGSIRNSGYTYLSGRSCDELKPPQCTPFSTERCGENGERTCDNSWQWGDCKDCEPGPRRQDCGFCGTQTRSCESGLWSEWSECMGVGCEPGASEQCASDSWTRLCNDRCEWEGCEGEALFAYALEGTEELTVTGFVIGPDDSMTIAGASWGDIPPEVKDPDHTHESYVARFDADGNRVFVKLLGDDAGVVMDVDVLDNTYYFGARADDDFFKQRLGKLDPTGELVWEHLLDARSADDERLTAAYLGYALQDELYLVRNRQDDGALIEVFDAGGALLDAQTIADLRVTAAATDDGGDLIVAGFEGENRQVGRILKLALGREIAWDINTDLQGTEEKIIHLAVVGDDTLLASIPSYDIPSFPDTGIRYLRLESSGELTEREPLLIDGVRGGGLDETAAAAGPGDSFFAAGCSTALRSVPYEACFVARLGSESNVLWETSLRARWRIQLQTTAAGDPVIATPSRQHPLGGSSGQKEIGYIIGLPK